MEERKWEMELFCATSACCYQHDQHDDDNDFTYDGDDASISTVVSNELE